MTDLTTDLRPAGAPTYQAALADLVADQSFRLGHIDCGVGPHEALGWAPDGPAPGNIRMDLGRDFMGPEGTEPIADLTVGAGLLNKFTDWPDHGIKTLSLVLSDVPDRLQGVAPGIAVVPMRIADGPVFQDQSQRDNMGKAMRALNDPALGVGAVSISMGNPGNLGLFQMFLSVLGAKSKFNAQTIGAFNRAYDLGIVVVCAAGQIIDRMVYPARYQRTIAVAGHSKNRLQQYPNTKYDLQERVDIWAQALDVNRAFARIDEAGETIRGYASDPTDTEGEVSGTSYATPQVAATALMWLYKWRGDLPEIGSAEAWQRVEAFRRALTDSADERSLEIPTFGRPRVQARLLNIERTLARAPDLDGLKRRSKDR
ncbi:MAG: S8/S53 family peptidase [Pseudomonadota bacterium]